MARPPHPGPPPPDFAYPLAEAAAAQLAAEDLAARLAAVRDAHEAAWNRLEAGQLAGMTADELRRRIAGLLAALDDHIAALRRQAFDLADEQGLAHQRRREHEAAQHAWERAYRAWATWQPEPHAVL